MRQRLFAIIRKEFIHIRRDPRFLMITIVMPMVMLFVLGHAVKLDITEIPIAVVDHSTSAASRELVDKFTNSGYFILKDYLDKSSDIETLFKQRTINAALVIPPDYSSDLQTKPGTKIQVIIDGSNSNTASIIINYVKMITTSLTAEQNIQFVKFPIGVQPRVWYNPDMDSVNFVIPGLVAIILMMICALLTSITIARENETGTMEQILVSPVNPLEIILGKVIPYVFIGFVDGALIVFIGHVWFGVPIYGSLLLLAVLTIVYIYAALALGLLISTKAKKQLVAMMIALVATMLPSILLSGFIYPIASMPAFLRLLSHIIPARYYLVISRAIIMKGVGFEYLWPQAAALFALGTFLLLIAKSRFNTKLD